MVKVLICGGGHGAHAMAGIAAAQPDVTANVLTLRGNKAEQWTKAMQTSDFSVLCHNPDGTTRTVKAKPAIVTKDPATALEGVDIVVFVVPAFAHQLYLTELKPFIKPGFVVVGLPGQAGFEFAVQDVWGDAARQVTLLSFETLPWGCRMTEFGKSVEVVGTKAALVGAIVSGVTPPPGDATAMLQRCIGPLPVLQVSGHLLGITLMGYNGYLHPALMYGRWHNWDGQPYDQPPLCYNGLDQFSADLLSAVSDEVVATAEAIMQQDPLADLHNVTHVSESFLRCYRENIDDKTNLFTCIKTNKGCKGLTHPSVKTADGMYKPNFKHRYMTEDIPYGLLVMRGIATVVGIPTPNMDKIIIWAQAVMGKEYLIDRKVAGRDLSETRTPQKYGLNTLSALLGLQ